MWVNDNQYIFIRRYQDIEIIYTWYWTGISFISEQHFPSLLNRLENNDSPFYDENNITHYHTMIWRLICIDLRIYHHMFWSLSIYEKHHLSMPSIYLTRYAYLQILDKHDISWLVFDDWKIYVGLAYDEKIECIWKKLKLWYI